jgi:hypothetical protein
MVDCILYVMYVTKCIFFRLLSVGELYTPACAIASCLRCRFGRQAVGRRLIQIITRAEPYLPCGLDHWLENQGSLCETDPKNVFFYLLVYFFDRSVEIAIKGPEWPLKLKYAA